MRDARTRAAGRGHAGLALVAVIVTSVLAGCATRPEEPLDGREFEARREILRGFTERRARVREIGFRLRLRARPYCGEILVRDAGLLLGEPRSRAGSEVDAMIATALDLRPGVNVLHVASTSPLATTDVREGDVLIALGDVPIASIEAYTSALSDLRGDGATFRFERDGSPFDVRAAVPLACGVPINSSEDLGLMTFQRGFTVAVPFGLLELAPDDSLAIAIAHQMAHVLTAFAAKPVQDVEAAADTLGLVLAAEAGYDVAKAPGFWTWLASEDPWRIESYGGFRVPRPHPTRIGVEKRYATDQLHVGIAARLPEIRRTVAEILRRQGRGNETESRETSATVPD